VDLHVDVEDLAQQLRRHQLLGGARRDQLTVAHRHDPVRVAGGDVDVVHHEDDRAPELVRETAQHPHHLHGVPHVQVVERLVEQDVVGALAHHHRDVGALPLAAGELVEVAVGQGTELEPLERLLDQPAVLGGEPATGVREATERHELAHGEPDGHGVLLAEHRQPPREDGAGRPGDIHAVDEDPAGVGRQQARGDGQEGGLPGAVGADQRRDPPGRDGQRDAVHDAHRAVGLGDGLDLDHVPCSRWPCLLTGGAPARAGR
jgi:hypothetical protein